MFIKLGGGILGLLLGLAGIIGGWKAFDKAGHAGVLFIIPIVNLIVALRIAQKPLWWLLLFLVPVLNVVVGAVVLINVAKRFDKSALFGIGLLLLAPVFWLLLGFDSSRYRQLPA